MKRVETEGRRQLCMKGQSSCFETNISRKVLEGKDDFNGKIRAQPRTVNDCPKHYCSPPQGAQSILSVVKSNKW